MNRYERCLFALGLYRLRGELKDVKNKRKYLMQYITNCKNFKNLSYHYDVAKLYRKEKHE